MNIEQKILKKNNKIIEKIIINLKNNKQIINNKNFFPKKKKWFEYYHHKNYKEIYLCLFEFDYYAFHEIKYNHLIIYFYKKFYIKNQYY